MKEWNPDDKLLQSEHGPHELSGVYRMHKAGWPGTAIVKQLGARATAVVRELQRSTDIERAALQQGRPIHEALIQIPKEKS